MKKEEPLKDIINRNREYLRSILDFDIYYCVPKNLYGYYNPDKDLFYFYNGENKIKYLTSSQIEAREGTTIFIKLFDKYFGNDLNHVELVDINDYFSKIQKVIRAFNLTVNITKLTKSASLGFPKIKNTLFKEGNLNNLAVIKFTLFKFSNIEKEKIQELVDRDANAPKMLINLVTQKKSFGILSTLDYVVCLSDPNLLEKELPIFVKIFIPKYGSSPMIFHIEDVKINVFNSKGYNIPKERKIISGIYCRVIRTNKKYHNFNLDDIILVQKIIENSKTPQANKALCSLQTNPSKMGLVKLLDLKRI